VTTPALRAARWRALDPALPAAAPAAFEDLLDELERWNSHIKLTAPAPRPELAVRVIDDSLLLLPHLVGTTVIDVGTGPGLPALPLAIARPLLEVRSVEAIAKKVAFTRAFLGRHPALRVRPFQGRAEVRVATGGPPERWGTADTVVSRAFAAPATWIPIGAPLVAPGGRLLVTLGAGSGEEGDAVAVRLGLVPGGSWSGLLAGVRRAIRWYDRPA
jgi:16S rRNA (guanine527-N7)-methyltransferase